MRQHNLELKPEEIRPGQTVLVRIGLGQPGNRQLGIGPEAARVGHALARAENHRRRGEKFRRPRTNREPARRNTEDSRQADFRPHGGGPNAEDEAIERANGVAGDVAQAANRDPKIIGRKSSIPSAHPMPRKGKSSSAVLNGLAFGDMLAAVSQCDELLKVKSPDEFSQAAAKLLAAQDRIIEVLRKLLDVSRHAEQKALADMKKRPGCRPARRRQGQTRRAAGQTG